MTNEPRCFFADRNAGPCSGSLIRAHLVPKQLLKRSFPHGKAGRTTQELIDDQRSWVPCCGGEQGNGGHHGQLDQARTLRIPVDELPAGFSEFMDELGMAWWVRKHYVGSRSARLERVR